MTLGSEFGIVVCKTLGINPEIVQSVVIEAIPGENIVVTIEVDPRSAESTIWAQESVRHVGNLNIVPGVEREIS